MDDIGRLVSLLDFPSYPPDILPVFATLPGPAFFPGGTGVLSGGRAGRTLPRGGIMVLGHNFGTVRYFEGRQNSGSDSLTKNTWRNLLRLLNSTGIQVEQCFFTNALHGLMRAGSNVGRVSGHEDPSFRASCQRVLRRSLLLQRPRLLLVLGTDSIRFLGEAFPTELASWALIKRRGFKSIDVLDARGPVRHSLSLPYASGTLSAVALLHPCDQRNVGVRQYRGQHGSSCEHAMVRDGLVGAGIASECCPVVHYPADG